MRNTAFKTKEFYVRYGFMLLLALIIAHYLSYQKLPFLDADYIFPLRTFIIVTLFGISICETNAQIYRGLNRNISLSSKFAKKLMLQYTLTVLSTIVLFSILYTLIYIVIFGLDFNFFSYSYYLLLCIGISVFETTVFTAKKIYNLFVLQKKIFTDKPVDENEHFIFKKFTKTYSLKYSDIVYLYSSGGIVSILEINGKIHTTNFTSLNEIPQIPNSLFFRINRQMIVNRRSIKLFEAAENRKLHLYLREEFRNGIEKLSISRYKSKAFKNWYLMN